MMNIRPLLKNINESVEIIILDYFISMNSVTDITSTISPGQATIEFCINAMFKDGPFS